MKWVKERGMERGTREPQQQRGRLGERLGGKGVHVQPLTSAEKLHANIVIQKQRYMCMYMYMYMFVKNLIQKEKEVHAAMQGLDTVHFGSHCDST